jgi:hypothetical protein
MSSTDTDSQCRPYATDLCDGDEIGFHPTPDAEGVARGIVERVRWEPRFAAPDHLLVRVATDQTTRWITRDQLVSTPQR